MSRPTTSIPPDRLADVLRFLARRCTHEPDRPDAFEVASSSAPRGEWVERLTHGTRVLGLRVHEVVGTRAEIGVAVGAVRPAVTFVEGRWWVVLGPQEDLVLPPGEAPHTSDDCRWFLVEHDRPAAEAQMAGASPLQRLLGLLRTERHDLIIVAVYAVNAGVLALATPLAMQTLINWLAFGTLLQPIFVLAGLLLIAATAGATLRLMQRYAVEIVQRRIFVRLVSDVTGRLARVRLSVFDKVYGPELANRLFDVLTVQKAVAALLLDGLAGALQALVGLVLLAAYHPLLLGYDLFLVAAIAAVLLPLGRGAERTAILESQRKYQVAAWVEEVARHPVTMKLGGGRLARVRSEELAHAYLRDRSGHFTVILRQLMGFQAVQVVAQAVLLLLCGSLVLDGELTLGQLVAAEFVVTAALTGLSKVVEKLETFYDLLAAMDKLGALVDLPEEDRMGLAPPGPEAPASMELHGLTVGAGPGRDGLSPTNLTLAPGDRVVMRLADGAVRGRLAEVLAGLRPPASGRIRRDGRELHHLQADAAQAQVSLFRFEDPLLASVRDNIALGRTNVDDAAVLDALDAVGLSSCVSRWPEGLDTLLGPAGRPLSDREVNRLLLARALAGRPRLLVVDGALDGPLGAPLRSVVAAADTTAVVLTGDDDVARHPGLATIGSA